MLDPLLWLDDVPEGMSASDLANLLSAAILGVNSTLSPEELKLAAPCWAFLIAVVSDPTSYGPSVGHSGYTWHDGAHPMPDAPPNVNSLGTSRGPILWSVSWGLAILIM